MGVVSGVWERIVAPRRTFTRVKKSVMRKLKCLWEESRLLVYSLRDGALLNEEKSELETSRGLLLKVAFGDGCYWGWACHGIRPINKLSSQLTRRVLFSRDFCLNFCRTLEKKTQKVDFDWDAPCPNSCQELQIWRVNLPHKFWSLPTHSLLLSEVLRLHHLDLD